MAYEMGGHGEPRGIVIECGADDCYYHRLEQTLDPYCNGCCSQPKNVSIGKGGRCILYTTVLKGGDTGG